MRRRFFVLFAVFLLFRPAALHAAEIDTAGAARLKSSMDTALSWYADVFDVSGRGILTGGAVEVVPQRGYYSVKIPDVTLAFGTGFYVGVGTIAANVSPGGAGEWLASMSVPQKMHLYDASGAVVGDISLGAQNFSAAWLETLGVFHRFSLNYKDIRITPRTGAEPFTLSIDSLSAMRNMTRNAEGTWSGPNRLDIAGAHLVMEDAQVKTDMKARRITAQGGYGDVVLGNLIETRGKVSELIKAQETRNLSEPQMRALIRAAFKSFSQTPDSFSQKLTAEDISLTATQKLHPKSTRPSPPPLQLDIARLGADIAGKGLKQEAANGYLTARATGIKAAGLPPSYMGVVPTEANVNLRFDKWPMARLMEIVHLAAKSALPYSATRFPELKAEMAAAMDALPQALAGAGTAFSVKDTHVKSPVIGFGLNGSLAAHAASPLAAVGNMTLAIDGLDEFINTNTSMNKNPSVVQSARRMVPLQMLGQLQEKKVPDDKSRRLYAVTLTEEGSLTLNGIDFSALQALMGKGPGGGSGKK